MRQKGFTLVEILVVLAVSSVLMTGLLLTIHNVLWGTGRSNNQVVALTEVNNAALQIKRDLQMAQNTDMTDNVSQSSVWLSWIDFTSFETGTHTHSSSYALSGTDLLRTYDGTAGIAGRNITYLSFTKDDQTVDVVITATGSKVPPRSETLEFGVHLRSAGVIE
jgi:prepilin-type N-terminal cleavage/methylation domain-containing protein